MKSIEISHLVGRLTASHDSRDPYIIASALGIEVLFKDLGTLYGLYTVIAKNRFIIINDMLDDYKRRLVTAHELGHDRLHTDFARNGFREFSLYDFKGRREYEANVFAAELLISDGDIMEQISYGYDAGQIAMALCTDINLIGIKLDSMRNRGFDLRGIDFRNNFLRGKKK